MAGLARRRGFRPGIAVGRERAVGEPQEGARRGAHCARESRAAHLRGAPARRRPDDARGSSGGVRHLARARTPDRGARLPEGAAVGAYRDRRQAAFLRDPLTERRGEAAGLSPRGVPRDTKRAAARPGRRSLAPGEATVGSLALFRCHPRFLVDGGFRQLGQRFVGLLFLLQSLVEQARGLLQAEVPGPGLQRPVAGNLIVLDRLRRSDEAGIEGTGTPEFLHDLLAFLDDSVDGLAGLAFRGMADRSENPLEALDLTFSLSLMLLERRLQLFGVRGLRHFRKRGQYLLLGVVDVLQALVKEVIERLGFLCHGVSSARCPCERPTPCRDASSAACHRDHGSWFRSTMLPRAADRTSLDPHRQTLQA